MKNQKSMFRAENMLVAKQQSRARRVRMVMLLTVVLCSWLGHAQQSTASDANGIVPPLIQFSSVATDEGGNALSGVVSMTFSLYRSQQGGEPLWTETQKNVQLDSTGHYSVQLGITKAAGMPATLFASTELRWLGVRVDEQAELPRVLLVSVPYALKAGDATTIGGLPPSAFMLASPETGSNGSALAASANAASSVPALSGTGKANYIPIWSSASKLGNSILFQSTAGIGIGTTAPSATLDVNGTGTFTANNAGNSVAITQNNTSGLGLISTAPVAGLVGDATSGLAGGIGVQGNAQYTGSGTTYGVMGTAMSSSGIGVDGAASGAGGVGVEGFVNGTSAVGVSGIAAAGDTNGVGVLGQATDTSGTGEPIGVEGTSASSVGVGVLGDATSTTGSTLGIQGIGASTTGIGIQGLSPNIAVEGNSSSGGTFPIGVHGVINGSAGAAGVLDDTAGTPIFGCEGNILIGRGEVRSGLPITLTLANVFRVDCTGKGFFDNGTQTGGADFAESVTVRGDRTQYAPGDLLVIDSRGKRRLALSQEAYSTRIAGIYSTKPGVLATPHKMDDPTLTAEEVPLAVVGIVPCKVTAENGPIAVGDLLVASSKPGFAMKGTDRRRMLGAVVGKAMEPLQSKTGVIEVLVTLQ